MRRGLRVQSRRGEVGQALPLLAVAAVALFGIGGLAIDGGRAYDDRRSLQASADTAADAGMRMLLLDFHNQSTMPYSDTTIQTQVANLVNAASTGGSSLSSYTAWYVDEAGGHEGAKFGTAHTLDLCTTAEQTGCDAGVEVDPTYTHNTYVLGILGRTSATEAVTSTSAYLVAGTQPGVAPYVIWYQSCDDGTGDESGGNTDPVVVNDVVTFSDNDWNKDVPTCGTGNQTKSNSFKGFITTCGGLPCSFSYTSGCPGQTGPTSGTTTVLSGGDCIASGGGNKTGSQPDLAAMSNNFTTPVIIPIVNYAGGQGGSYMFGIQGFAAVIPNSNQLTGTVVHLCPSGNTSAQCQQLYTNQTLSSGFLH